VGWWAIVSDDYYVPRAEGGPDRLLPRGALVRYREWYGAAAPNVGLKMTPRPWGGDRRARTQRSHSPLWGARSRVLQGGRRPLPRRADQQGIDPSAPAPIPRCRQFPRATARVNGGLGSAALPSAKMGGPGSVREARVGRLPPARPAPLVMSFLHPRAVVTLYSLWVTEDSLWVTEASSLSP
jgi:hypothetical protein